MELFLNNLEAVATLVSVLVAIFFGWLGFRRNQQRERMEYTVSVLMERFRNDHVRNARQLIYERLEQNLAISYEDLTTNEYHDIMNLLAFFEFVSVSTNDRRLDTQTIIKMSGKSMAMVFNACAPMLKERRNSLNRPDMFSDLERFLRKSKLLKNYGPTID